MMKNSSSGSFSARLRRLTDELRTVDRELKFGSPPEESQLREFRQVLDNTRMTAWTVGELINARDAQRDPGTALSFLTSERLRRFGQLAKDLSTDIEQHGITWQTHGIQTLYQYVNLLHEHLGRLVAKHRAQAEKVGQ